MRALMDTTQQGNLLKTQPSPVIHQQYNNFMLSSLLVLTQTEGAHLASVDTLLTRIVGFTGAMNQELKKLTAQQVIDLIMSKPEIKLPEWAQDLARKSTPETQLIAFLPLLSHLKQWSLNPYARFNIFITSPLNNRYKDNSIYMTLPIFWITNAVPDLTNSVPRYPSTESIFSNGEPTVNTTKRTSTIKQSNRKRVTKSELTKSVSQQTVIQTVERPQHKTTTNRSVHNLLNPKISTFLQQQTPRISLLPYSTERDQEQ
ncbi:MAG: hypothetical protein EZS28_025936 [Streblomastix strix]|uniref:Uncharacterized protein n=1 Tax=Streblomastix strix TaxID=222440 RepID=A0A5J4V850_9EUKA|nr:MAG: hypothetical protein EZS28_025936 [Streblomastix strix]